MDPHDPPPHQPPSRVPFSRPPARPKTWWGTIPGQLAILVIVGGVIVILLGLAGVLGPRSS